MNRRLVILHWTRFGPYHRARLRAAQAMLVEQGWRIVGLEVAGSDATYAWREEEAPDGVRRLFPQASYEDFGPLTLWRAVWGQLTALQPVAVAVSGYRTPDALASLAWARRHRRPAILLTESKADDARRRPLIEGLKKALLAQYSGAVCGGVLHRDYLQMLGMDPEHIFVGYDVVDNDYFEVGARAARRTPEAYSHLPGLGERVPFFLASARFVLRKNLDMLLAAYRSYRQQFSDEEHPWRLIILGDGPQRGALQGTIREMALDGVTLAGFRQIEELPAYLGLSCLFIHPPLQEQWGLVVNEAMAAGLPVLVSSACGCAPDLIEEGRNGFTFDPHDPEGLALLMLGATRGKFDLARMGLASRAIISKWAPERFASALGQALTSAMPTETSQ